MILGSNVKVKPEWWGIVPMLSRYTANALGWNIYLPKRIYKNLQTDNPKSEWVAILIHEEEHIKRQKQIGIIKFGLKYLFFPKFRFNEEIEAMKPQMKYLKSKGSTFNTSKAAKFLSGYLYLWPVSYDYAKKILDKTWSAA